MYNHFDPSIESVNQIKVMLLKLSKNALILKDPKMLGGIFEEFEQYRF